MRLSKKVVTRSCISFAALFVNVNATIDRGSTPCVMMRLVIRAVITLVFPDPAPAITRTEPAIFSTALR